MPACASETSYNQVNSPSFGGAPLEGLAASPACGIRIKGAAERPDAQVATDKVVRAGADDQDAVTTVSFVGAATKVRCPVCPPCPLPPLQ